MLSTGASTTMDPCPNCGHINRVGLLFCEECGRNLASTVNVTLPTRKIKNEKMMRLQKQRGVQLDLVKTHRSSCIFEMLLHHLNYQPLRV
jgi:uncharacterized Zn finger protein (UPF0148 family)